MRSFYYSQSARSRADDIRQKIVDEIETRIGTITTGNGYETNVGSNVAVWRDMERAPFPSDNLDAANVKDVTTVETREEQAMGTTQHTLTVHVEFATQQTSIATDAHLRKILADIIKAIGTDRRWNDGTENLAWDTRVVSTAIDVKQVEEIIGGGQLVFEVVYTTLDFDPYNTNH